MGKNKTSKGKAGSGADAGSPPTAEEAVQHVAKHKLLGGRKGKAVTYRSPLDQLPVAARGSADCPVEVVSVGAFEALVQAGAAGGCVLDFASDSNPGGSWRSKQQGTQEEALCRASTLGLKLEAHFAETGSGGYMPGKESCVYVPDVAIFWVKDSGWLVPAIPCAVVAAALRDVNGDVGALRRKVRSVLVTAAAHGHRRLVLGAWLRRVRERRGPRRGRVPRRGASGGGARRRGARCLRDGGLGGGAAQRGTVQRSLRPPGARVMVL